MDCSSAHAGRGRILTNRDHCQRAPVFVPAVHVVSGWKWMFLYTVSHPSKPLQ